MSSELRCGDEWMKPILMQCCSMWWVPQFQEQRSSEEPKHQLFFWFVAALAQAETSWIRLISTMAVKISAERALTGEVCTLEVQPDLTIRELKETMKKVFYPGDDEVTRQLRSVQLVGMLNQPETTIPAIAEGAKVQVVFSMKPTVESASAEESGFPAEELFDVKIPDGVTQIGDGAFQDCHSLVRVTIPDSVTEIRRGFANCKSLTSLTIPNSVTDIGSVAFFGCSSLTSLTIPNSVTDIGSVAFFGCSSLTSLTIPNSVTSFGNSAFQFCISLTSVVIPQSVTEIEAAAFADCSSLTSVMIPGSVTRIGGYAFRGCSSLMSVNIPDSVAEIGISAFEHCSSLKRVRIPYSVTHIGPSAFEGCSSLTSVVITNVQTRIAINAFYGCRGLPFFLRVKLQRASRTCVAVGHKNQINVAARRPAS